MMNMDHSKLVLGHRRHLEAYIVFEGLNFDYTYTVCEANQRVSGIRILEIQSLKGMQTLSRLV